MEKEQINSHLLKLKPSTS